MDSHKHGISFIFVCVHNKSAYLFNMRLKGKIHIIIDLPQKK